MATKLQPPPAYVVPSYEGDYAGWLHHQAMLLRAGQMHLVDRAWIAEELEDLGKNEYRRLESSLRLILMHLLKWDYQPERRSRSWSVSINNQRRQLARQLEESPSLKARLAEATTEAYRDARGEASIETDLAITTFPVECPYDWQAIVAKPAAMPDDA
jgi:C4-dicarboxylate-specific signal transduction histidine kinase